jgi:hypothetical protein
MRLFTLARFGARLEHELLPTLPPGALFPCFTYLPGHMKVGAERRSVVVSPAMATGDEKRAAIVARQAEREEAERKLKGPSTSPAARPRKPRTNWAATRPIHGNPRGRAPNKPEE